jgi:hypothetical protein
MIYSPAERCYLPCRKFQMLALHLEPGDNMAQKILDQRHLRDQMIWL